MVHHATVLAVPFSVLGAEVISQINLLEVGGINKVKP